MICSHALSRLPAAKQEAVVKGVYATGVFAGHLACLNR